MINVVVLIRLKEGSRETFLHEFQKVVPLVRDEQGCVEYGPTIDVDTGIEMFGAVDPNRVTILERWETVDALQAHLVAPHMIEYRPKVKELIEQVEAVVTEPVSE